MSTAADRELGSTLRALREDAGLSLSALARRVYFSRSHLCNVERGKRRATPALINAYREAIPAADRSLPDPGKPPRRRRPALAARREALGHTQESLSEVLDVAVSTVARWEQGVGGPLPSLRRPLAEALAVSLDELDRLLGGGDSPPGGARAHNDDTRGEEDHPTNRRDALRLGLAVAAVPGLLSRVLEEAAGEAAEFTRAAGAGVGRDTFDHLHAVVSELDHSYSGGRPAEQFVFARAYRAWVQQLIERRPTLTERRELYVYAAWLDELLASLANELGDAQTAEAYAVDCFAYADEAGHDELCAWGADVMASIATYAQRPEQAAAAAMRGIGRAPTSHPVAVRLRAKAARAHAQLGQREECEELLAQARQLHERLPAQAPTRCIVDTGSVLPAYAASSYVWLGDFDKARRHAEEAVAVGETSPVTEAIARIDLATALAELGSPDEAVGQGLFALDSPRLVRPVLVRAGDLVQTVAARYPDLPEVQELRERLAHVRQVCAP